jgi:hypothetical protein
MRNIQGASMTRKPWIHTAKPKAKSGRRTIEDMGYWDLVKILDDEFSFYVRAGTAVKQGHPGLSCYTCGNCYHWRDMDNGHFIGREYTGTRWHMSNTKPQCQSCNRFREGEKSRFALHLSEDGIDLRALQDIADLNGKSHPPVEWLREQIAEYRRVNKGIMRAIKELEG